MTIAFNGSTGYLNHPARIANSYPFSMAVWVAASTGVSNQFAIQQAQSNGDRYASGWFTTFGNNQLATIRNPGNSISATKTAAPALSSTVMRLMIVVFESATSRRVYFGSSTPTTDTATTTDDTSNHDRCTLGAFWANSAGSPSLYLTGSLAEAHWFNTALTGTDYTAMEGGALPESIGGWVDGWTLQSFNAGGTYTSLGGSRTMTAVGGVSSSGLTHPITRGGGDTTAPTLTSPTGTQTGSTTASGTVSTNEANGTLFRLASINATESVATIKAANLTQAVTATGVQNVTFTGLTASTTYFAHYVHTDAANNDSARATSASFTTAAGGDTTAPVLTGSITVGTVTTSSIQMSWPAGSDNVAVVGYDVSSNGGSSYTQLGNVLTHTFTGLTPSTTYQLRVRARDAAGNLSTPVLSASQSTRHGILGSVIRANTATGTHGPGLLYNDWDPGDDAKEFRALIVTPPASGTLVTYEDGSFELTGAANGNYSLTYRLFVDGVDLGTATASFEIGNTFALSPAGIASTNAFGVPTVTRAQTFAVAPSGVPSGTAFGSPTLTFTDTTLTVTLTLTTDGTTPAASLTGLKWAFFDQATPDLFTAPSAKGAIETTNGSGVIVIPVPGTTLTPGQVGWLTVTDSNGTTTQSPAHKAFSGPVTVN